MSNELGARNPKSAAFSVVVVTIISFIISVIFAVAVLILRDVISYAFTEGEVVAAAVSDLCPLLALAIVINGIQPVLSGIISPLLFSSLQKSTCTVQKLIMRIMENVAMQCEGVAVGCGWQTFVAYVNVGCYYGVGIPLGCIMGFVFKLGAKVCCVSFTFVEKLVRFCFPETLLPLCWLKVGPVNREYGWECWVAPLFRQSS